MRLFERALRRSGLPVKMSQGYNPRPQVSFPVALALGVESRQEIFDVELTRWVSPRSAKARLESRMPRGIAIRHVQAVEHGEKADVTAAEYSVKMGVVPTNLGQRLREFMDSKSAVVKRPTKSGTKEIDVRRFVEHARIDGDTLELRLGVSPAGSVRPEEVLEAVLREPIQALAPLSVTRTRLDLSSPP